ncbi:hypothetical protein V5O48_009190 [Marasmius crinis-equi]|uniref:F-box domain-containing protein n=1 Tax=Marasmius crinis-equi TaxID=585013 RepID=A0ABR3FBZ7_9AGAR
MSNYPRPLQTPIHHAPQNRSTSAWIPLPPEIIWMIIEEVDLASASQCARAASCFVYPARRRIFQRICLFETEYDHMTPTVGGRLADLLGLHYQRTESSVRHNRCIRLIEILDGAPEIRGLVKELVVEGRTSRGTLNPVSSWYSAHDSPLSSVLSRLPCLESISFLFPLSRPLLFRSLPLDSAHAIIRTVQSPTLRKITLENVLFENSASDPSDLLHFIRLCALGAGLSELSVSEHYTGVRAQDMWTAAFGTHHGLHEGHGMDGSTWRLKDLMPLPASSTRNYPVPLSSLSITGTGFLTRVFLDWAMEPDSPISLSKLSSLTLGGLSRNSISRASRVIQRSSQTLQHLAFTQESYHLSAYPASLQSSFSTSELLPVQNLRFVENHWDELRSCPTLHRWCTVIESSCFRQLTHFTVDIHWYLDSIARASRFRSVSWHRLESALYRVSPDAKLCVNVKMTISQCSDAHSVSQWWNIIGPDSGALLAECFPLAHHKKDGFTFTVTVEGPVCVKQESPSYEYTPARGWAQTRS